MRPAASTEPFDWERGVSILLEFCLPRGVTFTCISRHPEWPVGAGLRLATESSSSGMLLGIEAQATCSHTSSPMLGILTQESTWQV